MIDYEINNYWKFVFGLKKEMDFYIENEWLDLDLDLKVSEIRNKMNQFISLYLLSTKKKNKGRDIEMVL